MLGIRIGRNLHWLLIAVVFATACAGSDPAPEPVVEEPTMTVEDEVRERMMEFVTAYGSNDVEGYIGAFADDGTQWWPGRRQTRAGYHELWSGVVGGGGGLTEANISDLQIHTSPAGDGAVASYLLKVKRITDDPENADATYQMSATWFKRDGEWSIAHFHYNPVSDAN